MVKATAIPKVVKEKVLERDKWCVWCGRPGIPNAHYIPRSLGGLGVEENILTLCPDCHRDFDQGNNRVKKKAFFRGYLQGKYPDWDEDKLIYRRAKC